MDLYIGIDPGSENCALVAYSPEKNLAGTHKVKVPNLRGVQRLSFLIQDIKLFLNDFKPQDVKQICMEGYSMSEKFGQHASGEAGAAIKLALVQWFGLDKPVAYPSFLAPNQVKAFLGNGKLKKSMIAKEVLKRWNVDFMDDNLADAYVLARVAYAMHNPDEIITQYQKELVLKIRDKTEWKPLQTQPKSPTPKAKTVSSKSLPTATPVLSQEQLPTSSTRRRKSGSGPSEPVPSTRPLRRALSRTATLPPEDSRFPSSPGLKTSPTRRVLRSSQQSS